MFERYLELTFKQRVAGSSPARLTTLVFAAGNGHLLRDLPLLGGKYRFFYTGAGKISTATGNARRTFRKLFKLAKVQDAHPHRFRDTFAVRLLNSGTSR